MIDDSAPDLIDRRKALRWLGLGLTTAGSLIALDGCTKNETPAAPANPPQAEPPPVAAAPPAAPAAPAATDGAVAAAPSAPVVPFGTAPDCKGKGGEIDETSANLRRALQYKDKAPTAEKHCGLCAQYEPGKFGDCGGCKLFTGSVSSDGVCLSFAPKAAVPN